MKRFKDASSTTTTVSKTIGGLLSGGRFVMIALAIFQLFGCAGIAGKGRLEQFSRISKDYEWALESSAYRTAIKYLDPSIRRASVDYQDYANIKISGYKITNIDVSADRQSISQDVELQYFLLDRNILKTTMDHQKWRYKAADNVWMLQTGLPVFPQ